jgi:hypothetical protein
LFPQTGQLSMRIRRRLPIVVAVLAVAVAVAVVVVLRKHAPPEPARLLPGADGFLYVNLQWMRRANIVGELPAVPHDREYDEFIEATGFQFERDLDQAALAVHYPPRGATDRAGFSGEPRFSEVFVGKIDGERVAAYLHKISSSVENYHAIDIFSIPLEGRTLRAAILGVDTVAASNHPDPEVIRGIIDRSRKLASPFGGPALLRQYYKEVPFASLGWAIFEVQPSSGVNVPGPVAWGFLFPKPAVVVASVRYLGAVHFRAEAITNSAEDARNATDKLNVFLDIFHTAEGSVSSPASDADVNALLASLKVGQNKNRAVLTATVPTGFIRKVLAEAPKEVAPSPATPASPGPPPPQHSQPKRRK